jgi:hypothetical protein
VTSRRRKAPGERIGPRAIMAPWCETSLSRSPLLFTGLARSYLSIIFTLTIGTNQVTGSPSREGIRSVDALVQWRCGASAHAHAHARKGRTARAGDRGGRWRRIVLGDVLAEHVLTRTKRQGPPVSGRRGSGSFGSGRTAGYGIGEGRTSPWLEAIAGIRRRSYPRLGSPSPCRLPGPVTRYETCLRLVF